MSESESFEELDNTPLLESPPKRKLKSKPKNSPKKKVRVDNREPPAKHWCLTWNDYDDETFPVLDEFAQESCSYMIYQQEVGEEEGRPHIQCYFELKQKKRRGTIVNLLGGLGGQSLHLEKRRGTRQAARNYCKKEETRAEGTQFTEHGEFGPAAGKRNDLERAVELAKSNAPTDAFIEAIPGSYIRYSKGKIKSKLAGQFLNFLIYRYQSC